MFLVEQQRLKAHRNFGCGASRIFRMFPWMIANLAQEASP